MQGKNHCRLTVLGFICFIVLLTWAEFGQAQPKVDPEKAKAVTAQPVGLVMDFRGTAYTADRVTGEVFCLPAGENPVHYATIDGEPTALAVDRQRTVYVGTSAGRILAVGRDGTIREAWRCSEAVTGLTVDRDGDLLIVTGNGTVIKRRRSALGSGGSD